MLGDLTIEGLQEAQDANLRAIAALQPSGAMGQALRLVLVTAQRYAVTITHVDTGALRASHRMEITDTRGTIYIDPSARNPRSGKLVREYARKEENRGGTHAFYRRTVNEIGDRALRDATAGIVRALP
jgi:hypothetical protein